MTCTSCQRSIKIEFSFCPHCGVRQESARPATMSLDAVLDRWQLHLGHDYRRRDQDATGATTAVYTLGVSETVVQAMRALLPNHEFIERERRPGAGDPADRLRLDIVPKTERGDEKRTPRKSPAPRLHLTDVESRQAATGQVLIARPGGIAPAGSFTVDEDGTVCWTATSDLDRVFGPAPTWTRTPPPWKPGTVMSRQACSDGETIYHVDDRRRSPRIRHTLRAVRTEFREIVTVGEQEAALAGFRSNGIESARDHFRNAWEDRHGTPWGGWAWLTWFEADASDSPVKRRWTNRRALAGEAPADESPRGGHPGPFGGPGYAPAAPKRAAARDHDVRYLLGRCANGAERDGGRVRHAVRDHRALCEAAPGRRSAGWSPHQADDCVTCRQCLKKLAAEDREKMQTDRSKRS